MFPICDQLNPLWFKCGVDLKHYTDQYLSEIYIWKVVKAQAVIGSIAVYDINQKIQTKKHIFKISVDFNITIVVMNDYVCFNRLLC